MKNGKFCVSKKVLFLVFFMVVVGGVFYLINYANSQKVGSEPKAASKKVRCYGQQYQYSCTNINVAPTGGQPAPTKTVEYYVGYVDNKKYFYRDKDCKQRIDEGIGNYCSGLSGSRTNCVVGYCKNSKRYYTDGTYYYLDSSCLGKLGIIESSGKLIPLTTDIENNYCIKTSNEILPLIYDCPAPNKDVVFYYKDGQFYKDYERKIKVTNWGVGNFCKLANPSITISEDSLLNKIVEVKCSDIDLKPIGTTIIPDKKIYAYAIELAKTTDFTTVNYYYDSAGSQKIEDIRDYCNSSYSVYKYKFDKVIAFDCSKNVSGTTGIFYMKNGKLTDKDGNLLHSSLTPANICKKTGVNMGCYGFKTGYPYQNFINEYDCTNMNLTNRFSLSFENNSYFVNEQEKTLDQIMVEFCGCTKKNTNN